MRPIEKLPKLVQAALAAWIEYRRMWALSEGRMQHQVELFESMRQQVSGLPANPVLADAVASESAQVAWAQAIDRLVSTYPKDWQICLIGAALEVSQENVARHLTCDRKHVGIITRSALRIFTVDVNVTLFARARQERAREDHERLVEAGKAA